MQKTTLLVALGVALIAFVLGRWVFPEPSSGVTGLSPEIVDAVRSWKDAGVEGNELLPSKSMRRRIDRLHIPSDRTAAAMYADLQTGDPVDMSQRIYDHLVNMNESNWKDVFEQTLIITTTTGRTHDGLWKDILTRTGQVAGESAMNHWSGMGLDVHFGAAQHAYYGWAMTNPEAARRWLENELDPAEKTYQRFLPILAGGVALHNSAQVPTWMAGLSNEEQLQCSRSVVHNLIQGEGVAGASAWLDDVLTGDWAPDLANSTFNTVANSVARTVIDGNHELASNWLERYRDSEFLTVNHVGNLAGKFWGHTSIDGLDFLLRSSRLPVMHEQQTSPPQLATLVTRAYQSAPAALDQWLTANESAPFRDTAVRTMIQLLEQNGDEAGAKRWREQVSLE